jgi:hypothetical protein
MSQKINNKENEENIYSGFIRRAEQLNKQRVDKLVRISKRNKLTAFLLTSFVGSVCMTSFASNQLLIIIK